MKKIGLILQIAMLISSSQAFAYDGIIEGRIKPARGDAGEPCMSGYMIEGTDFETNASISLCAKVSAELNFGPMLSNKLGKMSKLSRAKFAKDPLSYFAKDPLSYFAKDPLSYFAKQGTMRFSGSAADDDIEFTISSAEIIAE